jgi:hypothetical protein
MAQKKEAQDISDRLDLGVSSRKKATDKTGAGNTRAPSAKDENYSPLMADVQRRIDEKAADEKKFRRKIDLEDDEDEDNEEGLNLSLLPPQGLELGGPGSGRHKEGGSESQNALSRAAAQASTEAKHASADAKEFPGMHIEAAQAHQAAYDAHAAARDASPKGSMSRSTHDQWAGYHNSKMMNHLNEAHGYEQGLPGGGKSWGEIIKPFQRGLSYSEPPSQADKDFNALVSANLAGGIALGGPGSGRHKEGGGETYEHARLSAGQASSNADRASGFVKDVGRGMSESITGRTPAELHDAAFKAHSDAYAAHEHARDAAPNAALRSVHESRMRYHDNAIGYHAIRAW